AAKQALHPHDPISRTTPYLQLVGDTAHIGHKAMANTTMASGINEVKKKKTPSREISFHDFTPCLRSWFCTSLRGGCSPFSSSCTLPRSPHPSGAGYWGRASPRGAPTAWAPPACPSRRSRSRCRPCSRASLRRSPPRPRRRWRGARPAAAGSRGWSPP
ncbi:hypothetical protein EE612_040413, partial [Oryza sativa]